MIEGNDELLLMGGGGELIDAFCMGVTKRIGPTKSA